MNSINVKFSLTINANGSPSNNHSQRQFPARVTLSSQPTRPVPVYQEMHPDFVGAGSAGDEASNMLQNRHLIFFVTQCNFSQVRISDFFI
jgi:hypothetical protein